MNPRTSDRLRFTIKILHIALTIVLAAVAVWISVVSGFKVQNFEARLSQAEDINWKQTRALYVMRGEGSYRRPPAKTSPKSKHSLPPTVASPTAGAAKQFAFQHDFSGRQNADESKRSLTEGN